MTTTNEAFYLVKYEDNWADEMDVSGHIILNERQLNTLKDAIKQINNFTFYVGTNEDIDYQDSKSVWSSLEVREISKDIVKELERVGFLSSGFAHNFVELIVEEYANQLEDDREMGFGSVESDEIDYFFENLN